MKTQVVTSVLHREQQMICSSEKQDSRGDAITCIIVELTLATRNHKEKVTDSKKETKHNKLTVVATSDTSHQPQTMVIKSFTASFT